MKIAISGKGGVGKTSLAAMLTDAKTWAADPDIRLAETGGVALAKPTDRVVRLQ